jgi:uncharacterized membrane protein SirB2
MNFLILKYIHICAVSVSFALFFVRGLWIMRAYPTIHEFWVRVFPALVDGVLLLSGLVLLSMSKESGTDPWMLTKFALLALYIVLGIAVRRSTTPFPVRLALWGIALLIFLFMTTVAVLKSPLGVFSILFSL